VDTVAPKKVWTLRLFCGSHPFFRFASALQCASRAADGWKTEPSYLTCH
jgi:hypothetical protein